MSDILPFVISASKPQEFVRDHSAAEEIERNFRCVNFVSSAPGLWGGYAAILGSTRHLQICIAHHLPRGMVSIAHNLPPFAYISGIEKLKNCTTTFGPLGPRPGDNDEMGKGLHRD